MIWLMAQEFLHRGHDVILDYGFWKREGRDKYRALAINFGVDCFIYAMKSDFETCKKRALKRTGSMPEGALFIDEHAFNMFLEMFEPMQDDEDFIRI